MFSARSASLALSIAFALGVACYSGGNGSPPPLDGLNFPVGIAVSKGGGILYVANADFDLQYNGGTIQSYDLARLRRDVLLMIAGDYVDCASNGTFGDLGGKIGNFDKPGCLPLIHGKPQGCPDMPQESEPDDGGVRVPFGQTCAPAVQASHYVKKGAIIGAFATGIYLEPGGTRLFVPVRGNASLTWADVTPDDPAKDPTDFDFDCGQRDDRRCNALHAAGNNPPLEPNNTRQVTMPGEPFGLAFTDDATAAVVTHQTDTKASLFATGLGAVRESPSLQFVLEGLPVGGIGVTSVPHAACPPGNTVPDCPPGVRPSFVVTSRAVAQVSLLRYYDDVGNGGPSSQLRPFLLQEQIVPLTAAAGGTESRGVVIDPTPRIRCVANVPPKGGTRTQADVDEDTATCQRLPARIFIANRTPPSLVVGEVGNVRTDGTYDPDFIQLFGNIPLVTGPSNVYLAPIIDRDGHYAPRLFVVCYDAQVVMVIDPETRALENVIRTGPGPFAMAFDPFDVQAMARGDTVPQDPRWPGVNLKKYRFAYIASFLQSYIQVVDLDGSLASKATFETIVYNLGAPTIPKGS